MLRILCVCATNQDFLGRNHGWRYYRCIFGSILIVTTALSTFKQENPHTTDIFRNFL